MPNQVTGVLPVQNLTLNGFSVSFDTLAGVQHFTIYNTAGPTSIAIIPITDAALDPNTNKTTISVENVKTDGSVPFGITQTVAGVEGSPITSIPLTGASSSTGGAITIKDPVTGFVASVVSLGGGLFALQTTGGGGGGTVTSNQGTPNTVANAWPMEVVFGGAVIDPRAIRALTSADIVTVVQSTGSNLHVVLDAGTAVIGHVIVDSGSITANIGTTGGLALDATLTGGTAKFRNLDGAGVALTSTLIVAKQALDVNIATAQVPINLDQVNGAALSLANPVLDSIVFGGAIIDPRAIRALTSSDTVTAVQATGTNLHAVLDAGTAVIGHVIVDSGSISISGTPSVKLDDGAGNSVTSQTNGAQRALDVGVNVAGVQVDPRAIRALTASDVVTVSQATAANLNATIVGTKTNNSAVPDALNFGILSAVAHAADVAYTEGNLVALRTLLDGDLVVSLNGEVLSNNLTQVGGTAITLGQKVMASSLPIVIASDQTALPVSQNGTWNVRTQDGSGNALTSTAQGGQRALDVGVNFGGALIDPRAIRALTSADIVTAVQTTAANLNATIVGTKTNNGAAPDALNIGALTAVANAADPVRTEGNLVALRTLLDGDLVVSLNAEVLASHPVKLQDGAGTNLTSTLIGAKQSLDVDASTPGTTSAGNSSTAVLAANGVFTGTYDDVSGYAAISISVFADQASAASGLEFDWSSDGVNLDISETSNVIINTGRGFSLTPRAKFLRIKYTNGAVIQTVFRLGTVYHVTGAGIITKPLSESITTSNFAQLVRAPIMGLNGTAYTDAAGNTTTPSGTEFGLITRNMPRKQTTILTTTNLGANAVFTGAWNDTNNSSTIYVQISTFANQVSAANGFVLEETPDTGNANLTRTINQVSVSTSILTKLSGPVRERFWRVRYTNGAVAQTAFELTATEAVIAPPISHASATFLANQQSVGSGVYISPGQWTVVSTPAANTQATASKAAGATGVRHVCTGVIASLAATVAGIFAQATVNLRDGASGAGTVLASWDLGIGTAGNGSGTVGNNVALTGLNITGSLATAMTLEFAAAGGASTLEKVTILGYDAID